MENYAAATALAIMIARLSEHEKPKVFLYLTLNRRLRTVYDNFM